MNSKNKMPRWFYQMGSPKWFYQFGGRLQFVLGWIAAILLLAGCVWGLFYAPADYQQGNSFRIIYVHVPSAILAQSVFLLMAVAGAIGLVWKMKVSLMVAKSCAVPGATFAALALLTGAIWGKPTWGTYWQWDARLTSTLILLFLYMGVMALHYSITDRNIAGKATAILSIIGTINIPIIKYSVQWWHTLHQSATFTLTEKPAMPPEMYVPLLLTVLGTYCLAGWLIIQRTRNQILLQESQVSWLHQTSSQAKPIDKSF